MSMRIDVILIIRSYSVYGWPYSFKQLLSIPFIKCAINYLLNPHLTDYLQLGDIKSNAALYILV